MKNLRMRGGRSRWSSWPSVVAGREVEGAVVVVDADLDAIQPASSAENVFPDGWFGEEVDQRMGDDSERVDFHFVTESIEDTVGGPKAFEHPCVENEAQFSGIGVLKQSRLVL